MGDEHNVSVQEMQRRVCGIMFIEINDRLINVDNITTCHIYEEPYLNICIYTTDGRSMTIQFENKAELMEKWEWLRYILPR